MKNTYLYSVFYCLFPCLLLGQAPMYVPHPTKDIGKVRIKVSFQDSKGWMWMGAEEGLFRFDGNSYQPIPMPDSTPNKSVSSIFEYQDTIWVGFQDGNIGIVPQKSLVTAGKEQKTNENKQTAKPLQFWAPEEGTPKKAITAFAKDGLGNLWIATYGEGLYCWYQHRLYQFNQADEQLSSDEIYALATDANGRVWAATDAGISICSMIQGRKQVQVLRKSDGLPDEIVTALLADAKGNIWAGTDSKGVARYNIGRQAFEQYSTEWPYSAVTSLALYEGSTLWIGTSTDGPLQINLMTNKVSALPNGHFLQKSKVHALLKDKEGLLWNISDKGEVYSANARYTRYTPEIPNALALVTDTKHRLWAGTEKGLFVQENGVFRQVLPSAQHVISLCETTNGNIWAGTFGNGAFLLDTDGKILRHLTERNGLGNGSILSISAAFNRIWLATLGGVTAIEIKDSIPEHITQFTHESELGTNYIYKVFTDCKQRVWFGTDGKGLAVWENGKFQHFYEANGITLKTIYAITEDKMGNIWFSTDKEGLFCFDGNGFRHFDQSNGLHSLSITGLAPDMAGNIVIAYTDGIDVLHITDGRIAFQNEDTGVPTVETNLNALCSDRYGNVFLGCQQGILRIANHQEIFNSSPEIQLQQVLLFMQPIDFQGNLSFKYNQNYFVFDFVGLWYTNPDAVHYRYKLEGFDHDWSVVNDHQAAYPNLPPGTYRFRVQASENGIMADKIEASYAFTIHSPIWTRWWFVLLSVAGVGLLMHTYIRRREAQLRKEAALKKESLESQFAALKSQINPHFLFNSFNTLITIIEENPKVAVEYVEHLSDFYRSILVYREKDLISVQEEMELVKNFNFLLKKRFEDNLTINTNVNGQQGSVMPLTLQMLIENAVKHNVISRSKPLVVDIFVENNTYIVVRNNIQPKIKPEPSTHFGLHSLEHRYKMLGDRQVSVEEKDGYFTVKVPIV